MLEEGRGFGGMVVGSSGGGGGVWGRETSGRDCGLKLAKGRVMGFC
jgi:hypothetical protein